jgi:tetratricopeptide (TPR) repeat protein
LNRGHYAYSEEERTTTVYAESSANVTIAPRFGSATLESEPTGATAFDENGRKLGNTPITLQQLNAGLWKFSLERDNYESVVTRLVIVANQTNRFQTNLVNRYYAAAMRDARSYFKAGRYEEAAMSADEALKHKAADTAATDLRREALGFSHLALAKRNAERENFSEAIAELNKATKFIPDYAEAKQLLADYTQREANRAAAEQKHAAELAEQARRQQEADLAERRAQEKIRELHNSFNVLVSGFEGANQFQEHELVVAGEVNTIGAAIRQVLSEGDPKFRIVRAEQPRSDLYALQARQLMVFSYRDCFVVCSQVRDGEVRILFKVLEYDHLPVLNLLGGILTAAITQPQKTEAMQEQFQKQIREGAPMVEARIRQAIGK